ncbi:unnamed protein product [Cuscuta epithymum]|uniref:Uncharacterized protein n=1 Tax=Cuscuta epithymum TaxID=186058 RepID=A0AAV0D749_9ASTE|nr:unnamed protein product [Cuscuta epithymum]
MFHWDTHNTSYGSNKCYKITILVHPFRPIKEELHFSTNEKYVELHLPPAIAATNHVFHVHH